MNKLLKLWLELKIAYYNWALDNINKAMVITKKQAEASTGNMQVWAYDDLLELAEDRIEVKAKIKQLNQQLNK